MTVHPVCLPSEIPDDIDKWEGRLIDIGKKIYKGSFFNNVDLSLPTTLVVPSVDIGERISLVLCIVRNLHTVDISSTHHVNIVKERPLRPGFLLFIRLTTVQKKTKFPNF